METTVVYWGHIGIMEKKMETTVVHLCASVRGLQVSDFFAHNSSARILCFANAMPSGSDMQNTHPEPKASNLSPNHILKMRPS